MSVCSINAPWQAKQTAVLAKSTAFFGRDTIVLYLFYAYSCFNIFRVTRGPTDCEMCSIIQFCIPRKSDQVKFVRSVKFMVSLIWEINGQELGQNVLWRINNMHDETFFFFMAALCHSLHCTLKIKSHNFDEYKWTTFHAVLTLHQMMLVLVWVQSLTVAVVFCPS